MIIKDVYKRIEDLENDKRSFLQIQEYCLGHTVSKEDLNNGVHIKIYRSLEDGADLDISLRTLASKTIMNIDIEIARLKKIIENTQVNIN